MSIPLREARQALETYVIAWASQAESEYPRQQTTRRARRQFWPSQHSCVWWMRSSLPRRASPQRLYRVTKSRHSQRGL